MARIISLLEDEEQAVAQAAEALLSGGIIVFPTDTVYGIMAHTNSRAGLTRLNKIKHRDADKPFAALVFADPALTAIMRRWAGEVSQLPEVLVPGPFTAIAPAELWGDTLPDELRELPYPAIGVRIPRHDALQRLLYACGGWLMASSANKEGMPTLTTLASVMEQLGSTDIALVTDGGECSGEASGIVSVSTQGISVVRAHPLLRA